MKKKIINVLECGADPSGTTDCTTAFKEAIEDTSALGVLVPSGVYKISGLIRGDQSLLVPKEKTLPSGKKSVEESDA